MNPLLFTNVTLSFTIVWYFEKTPSKLSTEKRDWQRGHPFIIMLPNILVFWESTWIRIMTKLISSPAEKKKGRRLENVEDKKHLGIILYLISGKTTLKEKSYEDHRIRNMKVTWKKRNYQLYNYIQLIIIFFHNKVQSSIVENSSLLIKYPTHVSDSFRFWKLFLYSVTGLTPSLVLNSIASFCFVASTTLNVEMSSWIYTTLIYQTLQNLLTLIFWTIYWEGLDNN